MKRSLVLPALAALTLAAPALAQTPPARLDPNAPHPALTGPPLALAIAGAQAALNLCKSEGYPIGATVVDENGGVRVSLTDDGAPIEGPNGSRRKAVLSAVKKASGTDLAAHAAADKAFAAEIEANHDWLARAGSLLITVNGKMVGVIAVEGQPHDLVKNEQCAKAGLDKIVAGMK